MKLSRLVIYKLGASPQLECWNTEIMDKWVLRYWNVGLMVKLVLMTKLKMDNILKKATIPSFHYSIIP